MGSITILFKVEKMYKITVEQFVDGQWQTITKTTDPKLFTTFVNLSGFATLLRKTRAQLRYQLGL